MNLQVNNTGAWKTVIRFGIKELVSVQVAATCLGHAETLAGGSTKFRITDETPHPVAYWDAENLWQSAKPAAQIVP